MLSRTAPGQPGRTVYANVGGLPWEQCAHCPGPFRAGSSCSDSPPRTRGCHSHVILARHQTLKIIRPEFMNSLLLSVSVCDKLLSPKLLLLLGTGGGCGQEQVCGCFLLEDLKTLQTVPGLLKGGGGGCLAPTTENLRLFCFLLLLLQV